MEKDTLSASFRDSLKALDRPSCSWAEVTLEEILDNNILKEIPFISTAISIYKTTKDIIGYHNIKKLAIFIDSINQGIKNPESLKKYRAKFQDNEKFRNQELECLLVLINRYITYDKPSMLAKLYLAYLDETIIWEEFLMYAEVIDRFLLLDCRLLTSDTDRVIVLRNIGNESILRLVGLGLLTETTVTSLLAKDNNENFLFNNKQRPQNREYVRTEFGEKLAEILK